MAYTLNGQTVTAGNGSYVTVFQVGAGQTAIISNVSAYAPGNSTLTLSILRNGANVILSVEAITAGATANYGGTSAKCITPITLNPGDSLQAKDTTGTVVVTASGSLFS